MAKQGTIRNFTSKGGSVAGTSNTGRGFTTGVRDPATGRVFQKPRPKRDKDLLSGGAVRVVNSAPLSIQGKRTRSLGMGVEAQNGSTVRT